MIILGTLTPNGCFSFGYNSKKSECHSIMWEEKNRIKFYLNDEIFIQFLFVYFTLDCHYFV